MDIPVITNLPLIADILVAVGTIALAIGTFALAYYSHKNIKSSNEQLRFLKKQTKIFTSHQEPYLFIQKKKFKGNKIELSLSNHGEGIAHNIAVNTILVPGEVKIIEESERLLRETPLKNWDTLDIKGTFNIGLPNKSLRLETEENIKSTNQKKSQSGNFTNVYPSSAVTFLFNSENGQSILKPGELNKLFNEFEPYFYFTSNINENKFKLNTIGQAFDFDDLKDFLIKNDMQYIGIIFHLVCRDKIGQVYSFQKIDCCVVDLKRDKTLEDAIIRGGKVPRALGRIEYQKEIGWQSYYMYKSLKQIDDGD